MKPVFGPLSHITAQTIGEWIGELQRPGFSWDQKAWTEALPGRHIYGEVTASPRAAILWVDLGETVEILALVTHPSAQKQGLMKALGEKFFLDFKGRKKEVWLEVHVQNTPARRLYEVWGFLQVGERPDYYGQGQNAVLMTKTLPTP